MSITSYSELKAAIASWLARDDLSSTIPDFITLFEAVANRRLRVRQMEASASLVPSSGAAALPADYLAWRRLTWTGSPRVELAYVAPSYLQAAYPTSPAAIPRHASEHTGVLVRVLRGAVAVQVLPSATGNAEEVSGGSSTGDTADGSPARSAQNVAKSFRDKFYSQQPNVADSSEHHESNLLTCLLC